MANSFALPASLPAGSKLDADELQGMLDKAAVEKAPAVILDVVAVTSGTDQTSSATYVNMAGTGAVTSITNFPKLFDDTFLEVEMRWSHTAVTALVLMAGGVRIGSTDYDVTPNSVAAPGSPSLYGYPSGSARIPSIAAGLVTLQARWRKTNGGTGLGSRDVNSFFYLRVKEVF